MLTDSNGLLITSEAYKFVTHRPTVGIARISKDLRENRHPKWHLYFKHSFSVSAEIIQMHSCFKPKIFLCYVFCHSSVSIYTGRRLNAQINSLQIKWTHSKTSINYQNCALRSNAIVVMRVNLMILRKKEFSHRKQLPIINLWRHSQLLTSIQ